MSITFKVKGKIVNIEGKFDLLFERKREDIKSVLEKISNGENLFDLFPISVAQSLLKQFIEKGYLDHNQQIQVNGNKFIRNPFKEEKETSIYSIDLFEFELEGVKRQLVVNMTRRLTSEERKPAPLPTGNMTIGNELQINDEKIYFKNLKNVSNRVYLGNDNDKTVVFTLDDSKYNAGYGFKDVGDLKDVLTAYVRGYVEGQQNYFLFDGAMQSIIINQLKDFNIEDLLNGIISKITIGNIEIINMPISITSTRTATEYAYLFMYNKLVNGEYLTINEMNEAFENEVLSSNIFPSYIKDNMVDFKYSEEGFKKYLDNDKYNAMSYKLRVMKTLLDVEIQDTRLHNVRSYKELVKYISSQVSPNDVTRVNLVLGYAMAKTIKNKIIDCIEAFQDVYKNISIISKNDGSNQKLDGSITSSILAHGVPLKTNTTIGQNFHDRYILFEMKDGTYKCMLATNEVGQFFNITNNEPLGSIMVISNDEIIKGGKSLITMVKEAK